MFNRNVIQPFMKSNPKMAFVFTLFFPSYKFLFIFENEEKIKLLHFQGTVNQFVIKSFRDDHSQHVRFFRRKWHQSKSMHPLEWLSFEHLNLMEMKFQRNQHR